MSKGKNRKTRVMSLRLKCILALLCVSMLVSVASVIISYKTYGDTMDDHYKNLATNLAKTVATQLDTDALNYYYEEVQKIGKYDEEKYQNDENYKTEYDKAANEIKDDRYYDMLNMLFDIKDSNNVEYLYIQKVDGDYCTYLFDADRSSEQCQLGVKHGISGAAKEVEDARYGVPAFISNDTYGWLCSAIEPVMDAGENPVAVVGVDVSMTSVMKERHNYLIFVISVMAIAFALLSFISILGIDFTIVKPINQLAYAADNFVSGDNSTISEGETDISRLNIRTGDEIENLSLSIKTMEKDIHSYIDNLTAVTAERERIGAELGVATHIQSSMLPCIFPPFPDRKEFDIYATMTPAKEVGGDFYDFFMVDDRHLAIVMADVSGKGVPAALFMVIGKTLIKDHTQPGVDLGNVFSEVNDILCESNSEGMFITAFEGVLDLATGEFRYVNAGHEIPFIKKKDGTFEPNKIRAGFVLAGMEGLKYKSGIINLDEGDMVFQYTDGVTEATNANNELFGMDRLYDSLNKARNGNVEDVLHSVKAGIDEFVNDAPQFDDITMLCLEYKKKMEE